MEMPEYRFDAPYDIVVAVDEIDAVQEYNERNKCSYFYGSVMCEVTDDGQCVGIDINTSRQECENIIKSKL